MIPNKFKTPIIYTIETPINVDRPIQEIQQALTVLPWIEKIYGRTYLSYKNEGGKIITYPEAWQGVEGIKARTRDLINVMPNDNLNSQIFFRVDDPINLVEFDPNHRNQMRATLQVIVWFNLDFINKTLDVPFTYRYTEILKSQIQRVISECQFSPFSSITILRVYEEAENVFRGYTIDKVRQQELVHPWGGFRFECDLHYQEDCPTPELNPTPEPEPDIDSDVQLFLDATGIADPDQVDAINARTVSMKDEGIYIPSVADYPFVAGLASGDKLNLKNPIDSDEAFRLVFSGGIVHDTNGGTFDGVTGKADTKINLFDVFGTDNMGVSMYIRDWINSGAAWGADNTAFALDHDAGAPAIKNAGVTVSSARPNRVLGAVTWIRSGTQLIKVYNDGNGEDTEVFANVFSANSNSNLFLADLNIGGYPASIVLGPVTIHRNLNTGQAIAMNGINKTFQASLGRHLKKAYFFGDSYTRGDVNGFNGFTSRLCMLRKLIEVNHGVDGTTVGSMDTSLVPNYDATHDAVYFIDYGLNECALNLQPVSFYAPVLATKIDELLAKNIPSSRIKVITGYFANAATWAAYFAGADDARYTDFIAGYEAVANSKGCQFINPFTANDAADKSGDEVHLNSGAPVQDLAEFIHGELVL